VRIPRVILWIIIFILLILLVFQLVTNRQSGHQGTLIIEDIELDNKVKEVAKIGKEEISYADWLQALLDEYGKKVLTDMINKEVVFQLANEKQLEVPEKYMDRELSRMYLMYGVLSNDKEEQLREKWEEQISYRYFLQALLTEKSSVDDAQVKEYFDHYKNQYQFSEMVQFSHITAATEDDARTVMERLDNGDSYGNLAEQYSIDEDTRDKKGYLGYFAETTSFLPSVYFDIANELGEGEYSEPYLINGGYAIVKVHRILPAIELTYEEAYEEVKQDIILSNLPSAIDAKVLWEELEVETIYEMK